MIIKYCAQCYGKPYTKDLSMMNCPNCSATLLSEMVDKEDLAERPEIKQDNLFPGDYNESGSNMGKKPFANGSEFAVPHFSNNTNNPFFGNCSKSSNTSDETPSTTNNFSLDTVETKERIASKVAVNSNKFSETIRGRVSQYSSSGKEDGEYRRLLPVKIYQAIVYRQRLEDVLHRFTVRVEQGEDALGYQNYTDIPVNVHGTISGGLQIVDNAEVEVCGKYKNGVLMADSIYVINNGYRSKVSFQHDAKTIMYGILSAIMFLFVSYIAASSDGSFFENMKEFCVIWIIFAAIITVLYLITSLTKIGLLSRMFSKKKLSFPLFGILLISLALAFLFVGAFGSFAGFGSYLSGWVYSLIPIIIIIVAVLFIIKGLF